MIVKRGSVVSHAMAQQWGIGKVVEVDDIRATIRFSDGMVRKIISSHFNDLHPADPASYHPPAKEQKAREKGRTGTPRAKTPRAAKAPRGKKAAAGATPQ
ncbi:DUF3553 domain-containing protein [Geomonas nitrogeniifigens]|uniref:DUF3553 domain-containing protein n=1 Tax=Geomonas diazotrophica TaxID=2843197 RepID=A0ABX8JLT0_9BACT|nr:DUF3553 domain-containing protein [Geomonas nitrogeniifigens]QWV98492.1 DUF3553 domain-containing protein [Geomonas nitrogeniifigens]